MKGLRVCDLMSTHVRSVRKTTPVGDIARILGGARVSGLPVVDEERTVVGVVSEADLVGKQVTPGWWSLPGRRSRYRARFAAEHEVFERALCVPLTDVLRGDVHDGVARLSGQVERRSWVPIAETLTRRVAGVTEVACELTYGFDDTHLKPVAPHNHGGWPQ